LNKTTEQKVQAIIESFDNVMNTLTEAGKLTDEVAIALMDAKTKSIIAVMQEVK
jgi:prophage DNA circulation protein